MSRRHEEHLIELSDDPDDNIILTELDKEGALPTLQEGVFTEEEQMRIHAKRIAIDVIKKKLINGFKILFGQRPPRYKEGGDSGVYELETAPGSDSITIALFGDWGTYTNAANLLAKRARDINSPNPESDDSIEVTTDYTIHLGDTYFTGSDDEIDQCFNPEHKIWTYGRFGSFAMLGNHEMYSHATHYYKDLLDDWMGARRSGQRVRKQAYSYFCLQNDFWKIIALDTGTDSPSSSIKPGDQLRGNLALELREDQLKWLKQEVKLGQDQNKGIILLSHHEPWGAFKRAEFPEPAKQLADASLIGRERRVLWFWGHEHYLSMYRCNIEENRIKAFGRCIGHAGMPVELDKMVIKEENRGKDYLVLYDRRLRRIADNRQRTKLGFNGFAFLTLQGATATIDYYDNHTDSAKRKIITETWKAENGSLVATGIHSHIPATDEQLTVTEGADIDLAQK
jgi:hypothetical protein